MVKWPFITVEWVLSYIWSIGDLSQRLDWPGQFVSTITSGIRILLWEVLGKRTSPSCTFLRTYLVAFRRVIHLLIFIGVHFPFGVVPWIWVFVTCFCHPGLLLLIWRCYKAAIVSEWPCLNSQFLGQCDLVAYFLARMNVMSCTFLWWYHIYITPWTCAAVLYFITLHQKVCIF